MTNKKPIYGYDVYYRLKTPSCVLVAASSTAGAKREFRRIWEQMSKEEIIDRFLAALDYDPEVQITFIDKVDELTEEDLKSFGGITE